MALPLVLFRHLAIAVQLFLYFGRLSHHFGIMQFSARAVYAPHVLHAVDPLAAHTFKSGSDKSAQCTIGVELCCRPLSLLMAYSAHLVAALASLWNVVDAAVIIQHFKSQAAANEIEGCTASDIEGCTCDSSETESTSVSQKMTALQ